MAHWCLLPAVLPCANEPHGIAQAMGSRGCVLIGGSTQARCPFDTSPKLVQVEVSSKTNGPFALVR